VLYFERKWKASKTYKLCIRNKSKSTLHKLYDRGHSNMQGELDLVKIIRNLKNLRIMMKKYVCDKDFLHDIKNDDRNIIDLDCLDECDIGPEDSDKS
jgi:hypothetical protein